MNDETRHAHEPDRVVPLGPEPQSFPAFPEMELNFSTPAGDIFAALAKAQGTYVAAKKDKQNPFFKSSYADLSSVMRACVPSLSENGICVTQLPMPSRDHAVVKTILGHASGQWISCVVKLPLVGKKDAQGVGGGLTYARRYGLSAVAGVPQEDDDANYASNRQGNGRQARPASRGRASGGGSQGAQGNQRQNRPPSSPQATRTPPPKQAVKQNRTKGRAPSAPSDTAPKPTRNDTHQAAFNALATVCVALKKVVGECDRIGRLRTAVAVLDEKAFVDGPEALVNLTAALEKELLDVASVQRPAGQTYSVPS